MVVVVADVAASVGGVFHVSLGNGTCRPALNAELKPPQSVFFDLPIGLSGQSVRHGKTRSPKADLTTLLKMRRATQVHHEYARPSDRANSSLVRLSVRQQNLDFREGIGRLSWWPLSCEP